MKKKVVIMLGILATLVFAGCGKETKVPTESTKATSMPNQAQSSELTPTMAPTQEPEVMSTMAPTIEPAPTATTELTPTLPLVVTSTPTETPLPTATPTVTPMPTVAPTVTPVPTATPTPLPTARPLPTVSPTPKISETQKELSRHLREEHKDEMSAEIVEKGYFYEVDDSRSDDVFRFDFFAVIGDYETMKLMIDVYVEDKELAALYDEIHVNVNLQSEKRYDDPSYLPLIREGVGKRDETVDNLYHVTLDDDNGWVVDGEVMVADICKVVFWSGEKVGDEYRIDVPEYRLKMPEYKFHPVVYNGYNDKFFTYKGREYELAYGVYGQYETRLNIYTYLDEEDLPKGHVADIQEEWQEFIDTVRLVVDGKEYRIEDKDEDGKTVWYSPVDGVDGVYYGSLYATTGCINYTEAASEKIKAGDVSYELTTSIGRTVTPTPKPTKAPDVSVTPTPLPTPTPVSEPMTADVSVGDVVRFGAYEQEFQDDGKEMIEWMVLDVQDGKALLLSRFGLNTKYYHDIVGSVTWEECTLRQWLNNEFYYDAFSDSEKSKILAVTLKNADNPLYGTDGGNDTTDCVFLLSLEEAQMYFDEDENGESRARATKGTAYARSQDGWVYGGMDEPVWYEGNTGWWLRSPGYSGKCTVLVDGDGSIEHMSIGNGSHMSIRPAIWVDLSKFNQ